MKLVVSPCTTAIVVACRRTIKYSLTKDMSSRFGQAWVPENSCTEIHKVKLRKSLVYFAGRNLGRVAEPELE